VGGRAKKASYTPEMSETFLTLVFAQSTGNFATHFMLVCRLCSLKKSLTLLADEKRGSAMLYDFIEVNQLTVCFA